VAVIYTQLVKGKTWQDVQAVSETVVAKLGVDAFGPNQTHYVNTSETDRGLLVEVHEKET
jgi:hypothetical protein